MQNILPVLSRIRSRLAPPPPLLEAAAEVVELEPGSIFECEPAISLPNELDRVTGFQGDPGHQLTRLTERVREEGPTRSYRLPNATIADFTVYCAGRYEVYRSGSKRPILTGKPDRFEVAQLCTTSCAESYFGHFLREVLPLELLAERRRMVPLSFQRTPWTHEPGYRALVGMTSVPTSYARIENLWITDERTLNGGWESRFSELRERVRAKVEPTGDTHVFMRRGRLGAARSLLNEDEVAAQLEAHGFRVITPEEMEPAEIASILAGARVASCVEGSAHNHAFMAMPGGGTLLSIQPPSLFNSIAKLIVDRIGVRFAFVVAEPANGGFTLDADRLSRTLDLIA